MGSAACGEGMVGEGRAWLSRGRFQTDGRTDDRTMPAGASVT
jgi:hypothetical protein